MIYFAAATDGRIKIGVTDRDPAQRLKELSGSLPRPLDLLGVVEGDHRFERAIHSHLAEYCIVGEWFHDCEAVRRSVRNLVLGGPAAIRFVAALSEHHRERKARRLPQIDGPELDLFARGARLAFGEDAADELAYIGEVDIAVAQTWLDGKTIPPRAVRYALVAELAARVSVGAA
jgi:hypothetical protein